MHEVGSAAVSNHCFNYCVTVAELQTHHLCYSENHFTPRLTLLDVCVAYFILKNNKAVFNTKIYDVQGVSADFVCFFVCFFVSCRGLKSAAADSVLTLNHFVCRCCLK